MTPGPAAFLEYSRPVDAWCDPCRAWTAEQRDVVVVDRSGAEVIGTLRSCKECTDPEAPVSRIRGDHGHGK